MDLIDRWQAIELINDENIEAHMDSVMDGELHRVKRAVQRIVASMPSAEKTGKWTFIGEYTCIDGFMNRVWKCNQCGWKVVDDSNYCPNCGARMEG